MVSDKPNIVIRQMTFSDIPNVVELQQHVFPGMPTWEPEELAHHLAVFPEGQLVAVDEHGKILGSASSLIIDWDDYSEDAKWSTITGNGSFDTHNHLGKTLYGADMGVDPAAHRHGIGSRFYTARKEFIRRHGLKRLLTGGRIPGYAQVSDNLTPMEYVTEVIAGKRMDPTLSFQLSNGMVVLDVVPEYLEDRQSHGFATLLEWLNPEYVATVSLQTSEQQDAFEQGTEEPVAVQPRSSRVRIAAMQYLLRPVTRFEEFATQVEFFVRSAREYRCQFVLFPEYFSMQLLSFLRDPSPARAVRRLAQLTPQYEALFRRLATESGLYIIGGTYPIIQGGELFNAAHLFTPNGQIFRQKKVHLTATEKDSYQMSRGHGFYCYHTDYGKIGILVCYDEIGRAHV